MDKESGPVHLGEQIEHLAHHLAQHSGSVDMHATYVDQIKAWLARYPAEHREGILALWIGWFEKRREQQE